MPNAHTAIAERSHHRLDDIADVGLLYLHLLVCEIQICDGLTLTVIILALFSMLRLGVL